MEHSDLLITTFTSVEDGAALVCTSKLLRVVEHLLPFAPRAFLMYDSLHVQLVHIDGLHCGMFCAKDRWKGTRLRS